jgi:protein phosphatase
MIFLTSAVTDRGIKKATNQDALTLKVASSDRYGRVVFALLCDGCGGLSEGEIASAAFVRYMEEWFYNELPVHLSQGAGTTRLDAPAPDDRSPLDYIEEDWKGIITLMNDRLRNYGLARQISLGTTVAGLMVVGNHYLVMNVGDSRVYRCTRKAECITHDHSYVQDQMDKGMMTRRQARESSMKNVLLRCVGVLEKVDADFFRGTVGPGDSFLLCCDGFWRMTNERELNRLMNPGSVKSSDDLKSRLIGHVDDLKKRGETDNISAILIRSNPE